MDERRKQEILKAYCSNEMRGLKQLCYPRIVRIGGISPMDYDDLYSIALDVLRDSVERYEESAKGEFSRYLAGNIRRRFDTYVRDRNRRKRDCPGEMDSLDREDGEGGCLYDTVASGFDTEDRVFKEAGFSRDGRVEAYLQCLSGKQRAIAGMIMEGFRSHEIRTALKLTEREYLDSLKDMRAFEKIQILRHTGDVGGKEERTMSNSGTHTLEKSKQDRLSVASVIRRMNNYTLRFDHPLQRPSEQWSPAMKGNLVSDILQGNPIPPLVFAEQIVNGMAVIWDLDGKQRCTNVYTYQNDGFKITKNIRRWNIPYQAACKTRAGKPMLDSKGFPRFEQKVFDIRGKRFSDLPEELKDRYMDYNFQVVEYLNCSGEDIAYHIARYNEGKPMTVSQKGLTRLGEDFASIVKSISAMPFFKEKGAYKVSESINGTVNRVVVESVMAVHFLKEWRKKQEEMCEFIKTHATTEMFEDFEDLVLRISKAGTKETFAMFDSRDSFLWFGVFARFVDTGRKDQEFVRFMKAFQKELHGRTVDGASFDELNKKATKDKAVVVRKIRHLSALMEEYLGLCPNARS